MGGLVDAHPLRKVHFPLLRDKLQHSGMRLRLLRLIDKLKQHRVCDVQPRELVECRRRHHDLASIVEVVAIRAGHHDGGIAAVVLVEAPRWRSAHGSGLEHVVHLRWVVGVEVVGVELGMERVSRVGDKCDGSVKSLFTIVV